MFNGTARNTTFVSPTQLTATMVAADLASAGTATVQVVNPAPGGASANQIFAIDTATATAVMLVPATLTLNAGQSRTVNVQQTGFTGTITGMCLNAPAGVTCTFNQGTTALTVQSAATTPKGTFALTIVFSAQAFASLRTSGTLMAISLGLPGMLIGCAFVGRDQNKRRRAGYWLAPLALLVVMVATSCGGGQSSVINPKTQSAQASAGLILTVQ
jgi:hypothetical protein